MSSESHCEDDLFFSVLSHSQCMQVLNIYERQEIHGDTKFKKENDLSFSVVLVFCLHAGTIIRTITKRKICEIWPSVKGHSKEQRVAYH